MVTKNAVFMRSVAFRKRLFQARQSEEIIEESFAGSLPAFVAAFTSRKKLSTKEIKELKKIIENNGGEKE